MYEAKRISYLLEKTYRGEPWHGPSLKETLAGVDSKTAYLQLAGSVHPIVVIVEHVAFWMEVVRERLEGKTVEPEPEDDWSAPAEMTDDSWNRTLARLESAFENLHARISAMTPSELELPATGKDYDNYTMLHGVIDHNVYHSGQIAMLRKALTRRK